MSPTWWGARFYPISVISLTNNLSKTHALVPKTTLDVEPRRIILAIPSHPVLDLDLGISDAEITSRIHNSEIKDKTEETTRTLLLKRQRDFDVDNTKAEWRVAEGVLTVSV